MEDQCLIRSEAFQFRMPRDLSLDLMREFVELIAHTKSPFWGHHIRKLRLHGRLRIKLLHVALK